MFEDWMVLVVNGKLFRQVPYGNVLKRETLSHYLSDAGFKVELEWDPKKQAAFIILKKPAD